MVLLAALDSNARADVSCQAAPEVQSALAALQADETLSWSARGDRLKELLAKHPDDLFINQEYDDLLSDELLDYAGALDRVRKLEEAHPDSRWTFLRARLVSYASATEATALLDGLVTKDPAFARSHLLLARLHAKAKEMKKSAEELERFFSACPDSLDGYVDLMRLHDPRSSTIHTAQLRRTLSARGDLPALAAYSTLWKLEFQAAPLSRHAALRAQVAGDLQRIRAAAPEPSAQILSLLGEGYQVSGDSDGKKWIAEQRKTRSPDRHAFFEELMSWMQTHPYPDKGDKSQRDAYKKTLFAAAGEWVKRWPREAMALSQELSAAPRDLPAADIKALGARLLAAHGDSLTVAAEYANRRIDVEQVPAMVLSAVAHHNRELANYSAQPLRFAQQIKMMKEDEGYTRSLVRSTLATAYWRLADSAKLREAVAQLKQAIEVPLAADAKSFERRQRKSDEAAYWQARAHVETLEHRKADALAFLMHARTVNPDDDDDDSPIVEARSLWKEMGGSDDAWTLMAARDEAKKPPEKTTESDWEKKNLALPPFALSDLHGRVWKSSELKGKSLVLVTWATWCVPCKRELPRVEQLFKSTKRRKDLVVLSLNVDDEVGLVQPFVADAKYTFPVLLSSDYARELRSNGIPLTWIADGKSIIRLERLGYDDADASWAQDTLAAAAKLAR